VTAEATLLVDFELYDDQGQKVWQVWHADQGVPGRRREQ
jgi:hypothetical protein